MKPIDAIEYALRQKEGPTTMENVLAVARNLYNGNFLDEAQFDMALVEGKERFLIKSDGSIALRPERMDDRVGYFREHLLTLRDIYSTVGLDQTLWLEMALVSIVAKLPEGQWQQMRWDSEAIAPALGDLADEFSELDRQLTESMRLGGALIRARIFSELQQMASAHLSPTEYVMEMRGLLTRDPRMGQFCTPWTVALLMARLLGAAEEVFDPAADASVLPAVLAASAPHSVKLDAVFFNHFAFFFNTLQARILGADLNAALNEPSAPGASNKKYTHCISAPPFGGRTIELGGLRSIQGYEIAINQIIKRLAPEGKAVVLVPESMLFSNGGEALRRNIVDQRILRAIISLPSGSLAPYAQVKTSILLLDRTLPQASSVQFVDASSLITTDPRAEPHIDIAGLLDAMRLNEDPSMVRLVSVEEIRSHEYNLNAARYFFQPEEDIDGGVRLGVHVTPLRLDRFEPGTKVPFARVRDLKEDTMEHQLQLDQLELRELPRHAKKLDRSALMLAMRWSNLKPTWFEFAGIPIAVSSDILVVEVDQNHVDIPYLIHELLSAKVQAQVERLNRGGVIPSLRRKDILDILIELPSKPEQQAKVKGLREAHVEALSKRAVEEADRHGVQLQQFGNTVSFKHRLGTPLLSVGSGIDTLRISLDRMQPDWRDHIVSAREQLTLGAIMENVAYELQRISAMLDADSMELDVTKYPLEPMDLVAYAKKAVRRAQADLNGGHEVNFFISADVKEQLKGKAPILGDSALLDTAMDALVDNARRHGFAYDQGPHKLDIRVGLRMEDKRAWLLLTVANSGRPIPEGFGLERYVRKNVHAGPTGHTGIGGYHVHEIVQHHKGLLELLTAPKLMGPYATEIDLLFPLAH